VLYRKGRGYSRLSSYSHVGTSLLLDEQDISAAVRRLARTYLTQSVAAQKVHALPARRSAGTITRVCEVGGFEHAHETIYKSAPLIPIRLT